MNMNSKKYRCICGLLISVLFLNISFSGALANDIPSIEDEANGALTRLRQEAAQNQNQILETVKGIDQIIASSRYSGNDGNRRFFADLRTGIKNLQEGFEKELSKMSDAEIQTAFDAFAKQVMQSDNQEFREKLNELLASNLTTREKLTTLAGEESKNALLSWARKLISKHGSAHGMLEWSKNALLDKTKYPGDEIEIIGGILGVIGIFFGIPLIGLSIAGGILLGAGKTGLTGWYFILIPGGILGSALVWAGLGIGIYLAFFGTMYGLQALIPDQEPESLE